MQKDPFVILGANDQVTQNELYEAYKAKRREWEPKRFAVGDEGTEACEKLDEIEQAYREADEILKSRYYVTDSPDKLKEADELIKKANYDEAQKVLDTAAERTAEWYFLQSIISYAKKREAEALEQLRTAVSMEPGNAKYAEALKHMEGKKVNSAYNNDGSARSRVYAYRDDSERSYRDDDQYRSPQRGMSPCDCCAGLMCADCCCECMGGDLISCC